LSIISNGILNRASPFLDSSEGFGDLQLYDMVWAHAVSSHRRINSIEYRDFLPMTELLNRGLQTREIKEEGKDLGVEMSMRYAAAVGAMNLQFAKAAADKVQHVQRRLIGLLLNRF